MSQTLNDNKQVIIVSNKICICKNCKKKFKGRSKDAKFCNRICYEEYRQMNRKTKRILCPVCNKEFQQIRPGQKFCSNECKIKSTENKVECVCEHCGEIFKRIKSEVNKNNKHYCSNGCRMDAMFWSKEDTDILISNYKKMSYKEMSENNIFSTFKTVDEISRRAIYIGITSSREWSIEEIEILKNNYGKVSICELMFMLPNRTKSSIFGKARSYNLKSKFYLTHMYSDKENEYIKNNYLLKSNEELSKELGRSVQGIAEHLLVLDLHRPTEIDNYKTLKKYIRVRLTPWRDKVREDNNYTCALTGVSSNIVVHHIRGFNLLFIETIENLNFPMYDDISQYNQTQLDEFFEEFIDVQESYKSYICINEDVHRLFHKEYGYGNNTEEQWNEFVNKHYK